MLFMDLGYYKLEPKILIKARYVLKIILIFYAN